MDARSYIETIAQELSRLRGRGLLLSPADAQLALAWHKGAVPVATVLEALQKATRRLRGERSTLSLQFIERDVGVRAPSPRPPEPKSALPQQLAKAAKALPEPARAQWTRVARDVDALLGESADAWWAALLSTLRARLKELPKDARSGCARALKARIARRPATMPRARYRKTLQHHLLQAASDALGEPPRPFLL